MGPVQYLGALLLTLASLAQAAPPLLTPIAPRAATCNTATNRQCWTSGFDINTDYETSTPTTGVTRSYTLTLTEVDNYVGGDGQRKAKAMLVNGMKR